MNFTIWNTLYIREEFFSKDVPSILAFFRLSGIDCAKPFFEIRPGTRFSSLFRISPNETLENFDSLISSSIEQKFEISWKSVFPVNFEQRFGIIDYRVPEECLYRNKGPLPWTTLTIIEPCTRCPSKFLEPSKVATLSFKRP